MDCFPYRTFACSLILTAVLVSRAAPVEATEPSGEVKDIFATQCSWCHGDWGLKPDKGPRLAGTKMTEQQVEERIRDGKPGYMPSFRKALSDQEITTMAKYIKSLKPEN